MKQYFVEIDGINTRITEWGNKNNPIIFCLHGMGCTGVHFWELADKLKSDYCIIAPDLPGFGKSNAFGEDEKYNFPNMCVWLDKLIEKLGLENFHILSHSWGANIGLFYIAEFTEKVEKMLMLDGAYFIKDMIIDYNNSNNKLLFDAETKEACIEDEKGWFYEVYGGRKYDTLEKYIEDEKEDYSRWSDYMEKAHLETAIMKDGKYIFHATAETGIAILKAFYYFPSSLVYKKINDNRINEKILLLASTIIYDEDWREITELMVARFANETGSKVKKVNIPHMMHWEKPDIIYNEVLKWFR